MKVNIHFILYILITINSYAQFDKKQEQPAIVYFSTNNGNTWRNVSNGFPQNIKIALGGIATSGNLLAVASKESGLFIYANKENKWLQTPIEKNIIEANIGALIVYRNTFYLGTQSKGVFISADNGKNWKPFNNKLGNLTIRRFLVIDEKLYLCTNEGLYSLNEKIAQWDLAYAETNLQVNGATVFKNDLYIATNKGIFKKDASGKWINVLPNNSVHNISADTETIYGMTYTSLLLASNNGTNWQNFQQGLPKDLYTFNVVNHQGNIFAGQWNGVYKRNAKAGTWELFSMGLPKNYAVTNMKIYNNTIVISTSERLLKK